MPDTQTKTTVPVPSIRDIATGHKEQGTSMMLHIKEALDRAGLGRTSRYAGGEITGLTTAYGSTGFSVRLDSDGTWDIHVVLSGEAAGLSYRHYKKYDSEGDCRNMHEPENAAILCPRIQAVFEELGFSVQAVRCSGWQSHWDDDVDYNVKVAPIERVSMRYTTYSSYLVRA